MCISSSDSDIDSTIMSNLEGSVVEIDPWDFEETIGDKISDGNALGGIIEPYRFEPYARDSDKDGDNRSVREDENAGQMFTTVW